MKLTDKKTGNYIYFLQHCVICYYSLNTRENYEAGTVVILSSGDKFTVLEGVLDVEECFK